MPRREEEIKQLQDQPNKMKDGQKDFPQLSAEESPSLHGATPKSGHEPVVRQASVVKACSMQLVFQDLPQLSPEELSCLHGAASHSGHEPMVRQRSVVEACSMQLIFQFLAKKLPVEWKDVGRRLQLDDDKLDQIEIDGKCTREAIYKMFRTWKQEKGKKATYEVLMSALEWVDRKDLVERLQDWEDVMVNKD